MTVSVREPVQDAQSGGWSLPVSACTAVDLLAALDPRWPYVVIQCGDPSLGWHQASVSIGRSEPRPRQVRSLAFDVLVTPEEAGTLAADIDGEYDGSLICHQFDRPPDAHFRLPGFDHPRGRQQAMAGIGVVLAIHLPHRHEEPHISSPHRMPIDSYRARLMTGLAA